MNVKYKNKQEVSKIKKLTVQQWLPIEKINHGQTKKQCGEFLPSCPIWANKDKVFEIKKELVESINGFRFSDDVMKYTIKEHVFNGGKIYVNKNDANLTVSFYYYNGSDIVVKEFLSKKMEFNLDFFQHFLNKDVENIYIYAPIVYNSTDIMEKYTKCGMCFPLNEKISDFLKKHTDLYAGMYLD